MSDLPEYPASRIPHPASVRPWSPLLMAKLYLGIDGGYSKTAGVLLTEEGQVLASHRAAGSSIVGAPKPESCAVLSGLVDGLLKHAGAGREDLAFTGLGLNGIDYEDEHPLQHRELAAALKVRPDRFVLVNDGVAALWGSSAEPK